MPTPRKDYPLESFDPRYEEILKRGARGEDFTIQCRSPSEAQRLQHMLHSFRHRSKEYFGDEAPERWRPLYVAMISRLRDKEGRKTILRIHSRHDEFSEILDPLSLSPSLEADNDIRPDPLDEFEPHNAKPEGSGG